MATINGTAGNDVLQAGATGDTLNGLAGNDVLIGGAGGDLLNGGEGLDTMIGGNGNDTFVVDNVGDSVAESAGEGTADLVQTSVNFTLGANVENLTGTGSGNVVLTGNELANIINGNSGANVLDGGVDNLVDTLTGGQGNDTYIVRDGADDTIVELANDTLNGTVGGTDTVLVVASAARTAYTLQAGVVVENLVASDASSNAALDLTGNATTQTIVGNAGVNTLADGGGSDTLNGLGGNDTYTVSSGLVSVVEAAGGGNDTVNITGVGALTNAAGTVGARDYNFSNAAVETITANAAGTGFLNITGSTTSQAITGNAGANVLNGGGGTDTLTGLAGNDTYVVDSLNDVVVEAAAGGTDRVISSSSYALGAASNVEVLTAAGVTLSTATSVGDGTLNLNALAATTTSNYFVGDTATSQSIFGDNGENILNGRTGTGAGGVADTLFGLGGSDIYRVYAQTDVVVEDASGGTFDFIYTSADYNLATNDTNAAAASFVDEAGNTKTGAQFLGAGGVSQVEVLSVADQASTTAINLTGNAYGQIIIGNFGDNVITDGGSLIGTTRFQDQLSGLDGDDTYNVTAQNTTTNEDVGNGRDVVNVNLDGGTQNFFGLISQAEIEYLVATGANNISLQGNGFAQVIIGNAAANTIDGAGGADTLVGGVGSDSYLITAFNSTTANIVELAGDAGVDRVVTSVSFDLANDNVDYENVAGATVSVGGIIGIEQIVAADGLGTDAINLTGNGAAQILVGNYGNNILDGDNDTVDVNGDLIGTAAGDTLTGLFGDDTYRVYSQADVVRENVGEGNDVVFTSGDYQLRAGTSIETLSAADQDSTDGLTLTGNAFGQTIIGTAGDDTIWGGAGNDTLTGRGGSDTFGFGEVGAANADRISDFDPGDFIGLSSSAFNFAGGPTAGFDSTEFVNGTAATQAYGQVLYNQTTGELFYDDDGTGANAAVLFATINPGTALGFNDFTLLGAAPTTIAAA